MELANPCWLRPPPTFARGDFYFSLLPSPKPTAAPSNFTAASTSTTSGYSTLSYGKGETKRFAVGFSEVPMLPRCLEKGEGWKRSSYELPPQQPHGPARHEHAAEEHGKAIESVTHHFARAFSMSDGKDDGSEQSKDKGRAEVAELQSHDFFPMAM